MSGPSANRNGGQRVGEPRVTTSLELGFTTGCGGADSEATQASLASI